MGTRLSCFGTEYKNGGTFRSFLEEEIGQLLAKNTHVARTARRQLASDGIDYLENICAAEQPFISKTCRLT